MLTLLLSPEGKLWGPASGPAPHSLPCLRIPSPSTFQTPGLHYLQACWYLMDPHPPVRACSVHPVLTEPLVPDTDLKTILVSGISWPQGTHTKSLESTEIAL